MIAFIDTEVNPQTMRVMDYGAVRDDGAVLHTHSKADFDAFVSKCDTPDFVNASPFFIQASNPIV